MAAAYLESLGMEILGRNIMIGHSDIDILSREGDCYVFVEVRTKLKVDRGMPEETLTYSKLKRMNRTATLYLAKHNIEAPSRLDAVCLVLDYKGGIRHMKHYRAVGSEI
jgi:putative endonuclease